ncbi:hypothetical protein [Pedosphaera parvula]|uniref:hypothetical protein n=1 Tax=Pedosphaera parvula TaxID=1032527 RepID=UPI000313852E|nr:hypothetical protein [Pedosphaera parvula]
MIPFIGYHFNKVTYLWQDYWDVAFLEKEKPDVVIDEMLERFFCRAEPQELKVADGLK